MLVAMMKVGIMWMRVEKRGVCMQMGVGLVGWCLWCVSMRVMLVVAVQMLVLQLLVGVLVVVRLADMKPDPERHQDTRDREAKGEWLAQRDDRRHGAEERRCREGGAGARGAQVAPAPTSRQRRSTAPWRSE